MNIAEITTYKVGGISNYVTDLAKGIDENILIITGNTTKSGYQKEDGVTFYHIPCALNFWELYFINPPGSYQKVSKLIQENKIELIHFHNPLFTFITGFIMKPKLPIIMTAHYVVDVKSNKLTSFIFNKLIRLVTLYVSKKVNKIICHNEDYIELFASWGVDRKKLVFIPTGVDTDKFSPGKSNIKKKLKCKNLVIFWGRLGYQKNIPLLIKAFKNIKTPDTKLVIVGKGPDMKKLNALAGKDENIIFTGYLPDDKLLEYIRDADAAVLPSRGESWGSVIGEAMACELPVISSDVGKAKEFIGEDRGIILKEETVEELAEKIDYLISNKEIAREMGKKARKKIVENYRWGKTIDETAELYKTVIKEFKNTHKNQDVVT